MSDNRTSRVIIAGWHDDSNKGDAAILLALLQLLDDRLPKVDFCVQLCVHHTSTIYPGMLRHTQRLFQRPLVPLTSLFRRGSNWKLVRALYLFLSLVRSLLAILAPNRACRRLLDSQELKTFEAYFDCRAVIGKGGHYFYGGNGIRGLLAAYIQGFPFLLARRLKVPYALIGISVGPYSSFIEKIVPTLVLKGAVAVSARERISYETIRKLVGDETEVFQTTDLAFWLRQYRHCKTGLSLVDRNLGGKYIILCPRVAFPGDPHRLKYKRYLKFAEQVIQLLIEGCGIKVAIVLNAVRACESRQFETEDDRQFITDLKHSGFARSDVTFVTQDLDPIELLSIYSRAELVIGTRLHSVIFGLLCHKPVIAISYYGPKMQILVDFQLEHFVVDINRLELTQIGQLIDYVLDRKEALEHEIRVKVGRAEKTIEEDGALRLICDLIKAPG